MTSTGRNVGLLAACQAMLFTNNTTLVAINGLAGLALTPVKALATLPVTCWILGGAIATMPASLHMKRVGRQRGLTLGVFWGIAGALLCGAAMWLQSFWLLCLGTLVWASSTPTASITALPRLTLRAPISGRRRSRSCSPAGWSAASSGRASAAGPSTCSMPGSWAATCR